MREYWLGSVNDNDIWLIDNTSTANVEYWGYAAPGTASSAAAWRLIQITKDANGIMLSKKFAAGSPAYASVYDNRTSLAYS